MDLNSLYPSVISALNMAPETIVAQVRPEIFEGRVHEDITLKKKICRQLGRTFATEEYEAVMEQRKDVALTVDFENGDTEVMSGAQLYKLIFDSNVFRGCLVVMAQSLQQSLKVLFQVFKALVCRT